MKKKIFVVVYGTLMTGESNYHVGANAISRRSCTIKGTLFDTGWSFPAFVPEGETSVRAELLEVTPATFADLDRLEGYPCLYTRQVVTATLDDGTTRNAWVYVMTQLPTTAKLIPGGDWCNR